MPTSDVTVGLTEDYAGLTVSEQAYPTAATVEKKAFTRDQLTAMDEAGDFYYGGYDSTPAVIEGRGVVSVSLMKLLENAGVEFLPGDSVVFTSVDGVQTTMTYSELYSAGRYYFPALYTGYDWPSRSNGKILCQPHLIITGRACGKRRLQRGRKHRLSALRQRKRLQLAFGLTMDEFLRQRRRQSNGRLPDRSRLHQIHHGDYREPCVQL